MQCNVDRWRQEGGEQHLEMTRWNSQGQVKQLNEPFLFLIKNCFIFPHQLQLQQAFQLCHRHHLHLISTEPQSHFAKIISLFQSFEDPLSVIQSLWFKHIFWGNWGLIAWILRGMCRCWRWFETLKWYDGRVSQCRLLLRNICLGL